MSMVSLNMMSPQNSLFPDIQIVIVDGLKYYLGMIKSSETFNNL